MSACHLYVLPLVHEDIAKVGISVDPLARVRAFAARYYECFDLAGSVVIGFDRVAEARRRETQLHRQLRAWNAPPPLVDALRAGGVTEWYRGCASILRAEAERDAGRGHVVWMPALAWWKRRLLAEQPLLFEWAEHCLRDLPEDAPVPSAAWSRIVDVLDAWPALGLAVEDALPPHMARRYLTYRSGWRCGLGD
ncbi:GIY-YIG nuclease family protein [Luteimonas saliphila]|uniref:GIY-YIG nuclease family protein n=1 Tax=Luteimonas saliphila TaxID=2804919 RepID=UPI00192D2704|nr:GIY-YIG nuclease family protein [Luteimonas saliphila]